MPEPSVKLCSREVWPGMLAFMPVTVNPKQSWAMIESDSDCFSNPSSEHHKVVCEPSQPTNHMLPGTHKRPSHQRNSKSSLTIPADLDRMRSDAAQLFQHGAAVASPSAEQSGRQQPGRSNALFVLFVSTTVVPSIVSRRCGPLGKTTGRSARKCRNQQKEKSKTKAGSLGRYIFTRNTVLYQADAPFGRVFSTSID